MPVIDLSEDQDPPPPEAGPSSRQLEHAAGSSRGSQQGQAQRQPRRQTSSEGEVEVISNSQSRSSPRRSGRRPATLGGRGLPSSSAASAQGSAGQTHHHQHQGTLLQLPPRPNSTFINLADDLPEPAVASAPEWSPSDEDDQDVSPWSLSRTATTIIRRFLDGAGWGSGSSSSSDNANTLSNGNRSNLTVTEEAPLWSTRYGRSFVPYNTRTTSLNNNNRRGGGSSSRGRGGFIRRRGEGDFLQQATFAHEAAAGSEWVDDATFESPAAARWLMNHHLHQPAVHSYANAAAQIPPAKYDIQESHPRKLARGFRRDVVPPAPVIELDKTIDGDLKLEEEEEEEEEVPVCASCKTELFVPQTEGDKSATRPCAIKCGHIICAACVVLGRKYYRRQMARKRKAARGLPPGPPPKSRKTNQAKAAAGDAVKGEDAASEHGIIESWSSLEPGEWIGCPVVTCDGANTGWLKNLGHPDGLWEIYLNVD